MLAFQGAQAVTTALCGLLQGRRAMHGLESRLILNVAGSSGDRVALLNLVEKNGVCKGNLPLSLIGAIRGITLL